jgi:hypothetical protein
VSLVWSHCPRWGKRLCPLHVSQGAAYTRDAVAGRNEMDPPLCGSTSMSHNDFGVRYNHVATGDESHETRDERPRD